MAKKEFLNKTTGDECEIKNPVEIVEGLFGSIKCGDCGEKLVCIEDAQGDKYYVHRDDLSEIKSK
jgi:hypothetical protein